MGCLLGPLAVLTAALSHPVSPRAADPSPGGEVRPALDRLYPFKSGDKWGYIDAGGRTVISPQYDLAWPFAEGLALVWKGRDTYVIDATGAARFKSPCDADHKEFVGGFARGSIGLGFHFYDRRGQLLPGRFASTRDFSEGLAAVYVDEERFKLPTERAPGRDVATGKWGFIDTTGKMVVQARYEEVGHFSGGLAPVYIGGCNRKCTGLEGGYWAYIDRTGKVAVEGPFLWARSFSDGVAWVTVRTEDGRSGHGLIDPTGKFLIEPGKYDCLADFHEGLAAVRMADHKLSGSGWSPAFIDKTGRVVIPPRQLAIVGEFSEGLAAAQVLVQDARTKWWTQGSWGYIDRAGEWVIKPQYYWAGKLTGGLAAVGSPEEGHGYTDRQGRRYGWSKKK